MLDQRNSGTDPVQNEILDRIEAAITDSELGFDKGDVFYTDSASNVTVEGGCNRTVIQQMDLELVLQSDTSLSLTIDSLYDPIVLSADVSALFASNGEARQIVGIRLGECQNLARDSFLFNANGPAQFSLSATLKLNPSWTAESTLSLFPEISLAGELQEFEPTVDVDDTVLASVLERYLRDRINDTFNSERLDQELDGLQKTLEDSLGNELNDGRIDIDLPPPDDEQLLALYGYLQPDARFPITIEMIRDRRQELLSSVLFGEPSSIDSLFSDALLCEATSVLMAPVKRAQAYTQVGGLCVTTEADSSAGTTLFSDDACEREMSYESGSVADYCAVALNPERLGNAASFPESLGKWSHSPGSRFDIGALDIADKIQPFMRRFRYKSVLTARGECELEMRMYSTFADTRGLKPLIALHGGSWQHRSSGFIGVEATATHFTNRGFAVFVPFYRLIGTDDGNVACNDATFDDINADANDALDWVTSQAETFGLNGAATLFGQSAGGQLALSLAVNRPAEVRRAILFYAPTDFREFARQLNNGTYTNDAGRKILEAVSGVPLAQLELDSPLVINNSFPDIIADNPERYPPLFILHGEMDSLLPFGQSVRLCNAVAGFDELNSGVIDMTPNLNSLSRTVQCGSNGSELHLIAEGEHALDLCLSPGLCLSGSQESALRVANSMDNMLDWASSDSVALVPSQSSNGGFGALGSRSLFWLAFILGIVALSRKRYPNQF